MIRALIIDDEAHNRDTLRKLLEMHCPQVAVVGDASGVGEGIRVITKVKPDLVFLDVNLKDGTGFDLLQALGPIGFDVIFISGLDTKGLRGLKTSGLVLLAKPIDPEKLIHAVSRAG